MYRTNLRRTVRHDSQHAPAPPIPNLYQWSYYSTWVTRNIYIMPIAMWADVNYRSPNKSTRDKATSYIEIHSANIQLNRQHEGSRKRKTCRVQVKDSGTKTAVCCKKCRKTPRNARTVQNAKGVPLCKHENQLRLEL